MNLFALHAAFAYAPSPVRSILPDLVNAAIQVASGWAARLLPARRSASFSLPRRWPGRR